MLQNLADGPPVSGIRWSGYACKRAPGRRGRSQSDALQSALGWAQRRRPPGGKSQSAGMPSEPHPNEHSCRARKVSLEGFSGGQVEGLIGAERHALGVGLFELLSAEMGAHLVQAVASIGGFKVLPR